MNAQKLYEKLENDFIKPVHSDDWVRYMQPIADFLTANFKERSMGLVCDFAQEVNHVYTATFPSDRVMTKILESGAENAMLFTHHPSTWDIRKAPNVFQLMNRDLLTQFQEKHISIYNLHVPLDDFGEYSTSVTFAKALGFEIEKPFGEYYGALAGVFARTKLNSVQEIREVFKKAVGHEVGLYQYGDEEIKDGRVALIAGGGNDLTLTPEIAKEGINTFLVGISSKSDYSKPAHDFLEQNQINLLGGTHESTEKFACIAMCRYFQQQGISSEHIEDVPVMEDL